MKRLIISGGILASVLLASPLLSQMETTTDQDVELLSETGFVRLQNPGVTSVQLLAPSNSRSKRITITKLTVDPGAEQPVHAHQASEQAWVILSGQAALLLADGKTRTISAGEVMRFGDGALHGVKNTSTEPFVYLSVTSPPIDFTNAYSIRN